MGLLKYFKHKVMPKKFEKRIVSEYYVRAEIINQLSKFTSFYQVLFTKDKFIDFLIEVIKLESNFDENCHFMEPAPLFKYSIGLFQLSTDDVLLIPFFEGMNETERDKDLSNAKSNIFLALTIMKYDFPHIVSGRSKYWSSIRIGKIKIYDEALNEHKNS